MPHLKKRTPQKRGVYIKKLNGKPIGKLEDFLTGFIKDDKEVYGKPVGIAVAQDGALLVADDVSGIIWRVAAQ